MELKWLKNGHSSQFEVHEEQLEATIVARSHLLPLSGRKMTRNTRVNRPFSRSKAEKHTFPALEGARGTPSFNRGARGSMKDGPLSPGCPVRACWQASRSLWDEKSCDVARNPLAASIGSRCGLRDARHPAIFLLAGRRQAFPAQGRSRDSKLQPRRPRQFDGWPSVHRLPESLIIKSAVLTL